MSAYMSARAWIRLLCGASDFPGPIPLKIPSRQFVDMSPALTASISPSGCRSTVWATSFVWAASFFLTELIFFGLRCIRKNNVCTRYIHYGVHIKLHTQVRNRYRNATKSRKPWSVDDFHCQWQHLKSSKASSQPCNVYRKYHCRVQFGVDIPGA